MLHGQGMISIWFFIGVVLLVYGGIIVVASAVLPPPATVLANLHAGLWWGGFLFVVGLFYTIRFRPGAGRE